MKLPLSIAEKLLLMTEGQKIPASQLKNDIIEELIDENILYKHGKRKNSIQLTNKPLLDIFLKTRFGFSDLTYYIEILHKEDASRSELVAASSNSKLKSVRTFKGFLVNCYLPIKVILNEKSVIIQPKEGTFEFIYDFEAFIPDKNVTIIGIENPENFRQIYKQQYLFKGLNPLFVSRYPQNKSKDLIRWLQTIQNPYLHFGDFDFAGIQIYLTEFKKSLGKKATFFIPKNIESLIISSGNKELYDNQKINFDEYLITEGCIKNLISLINTYKKGLEQEVLIQK